MPREPTSELLKVPLLGTWQIDGSDNDHPGMLYLEGDDLRLKIFIDRVERAGRDYRHPTLDAVAPPGQPSCIGQTQRAGVVTLLRCAKLQWNGLEHLPSGESRVELTLQPTQAWIGGESLDGASEVYSELSFEPPGLHNVLSTAHIRQEFLRAEGSESNAVKSQFADLMGASRVYLVHAAESPRACIEHDGKQFEVIFSTTFSESHSSVAGVNIQSRDSVVIRRPSSTINELMSVKFQIEQFLSVLCIGRVVAQEVIVSRGEREPGLRRLWELGRETVSEPTERMPHQVLVSLGQHPDLVGPVLQRWFEVSEQRQLARWLIYDSLGKKTFSTSRFLALAQAWEIAGREVNTRPTHNRRLFADACDEAEAVLKRHLGDDAGQRLSGMLRSNNRPSFRTLVEECLAQTPEQAVVQICGDATRFARAVADVRNTLTHMQGGRRFTIDQASRWSLYLAYKLTILFCILEARLLGLPLENLSTVLANNDMARAARRPLPEL